MAVWSSITTSKMEYTRIDADYYHPDYLSEMVLWRELKQKNNVSKLRHLIRVPVRTGRTPSSRIIKDGELCIPFIKTDTLREGSVDFNNSDFLPARALSNNDYIPKDSVVITIIGATPEIVGRAAIVRPEDPDCVTNQNVAVVCTNEECDPYYLTAFFQTKLGRDQLWRHSRRTEQVNLNCREVERVLVPLLTNGQQKEIGDLVRASFLSSDHSIDLYKQAQHLLESELGLDKLKFKKPVGYTARFSELEQSRRVDSEFFNPELRHFWQKLSTRFEMIPISKLVAIFKFANPSYGTGGMPIVTQKHLRSISPEGYGDELRTTVSWQQANPMAILRCNDLLFYSVGAYLGKTNLWLNSDTAVPASFITLLRCYNDHNAGFLHMVLNSRYGILQSKCFQSGTSQQYIYPKDIRKFLIPEVNEKLREKLNELVTESYEKGIESKKLLNQAKARVEQLIEEAEAQ